MRIAAAVLAAGQGTRYGADKTRLILGGKPLWRWSYEALLRHPSIDEVLLVGSPLNIEELRSEAAAILGGNTRQESSAKALQALPGMDALLIHDAARPFLTQNVITRVVEGVLRSGAAAACIPVTDTIRRVTVESTETLVRSELVAMQTPQGATCDLLRKAHAQANGTETDDIAMLQAIGVHPELVEGDVNNFKVTTPEDLARAQALVANAETRTGIGYDIHRFSSDAGRKCVLGGVEFDGKGLEGHSDADVLLHAVTDALFGAASLGDIGQHFPNTDPRWSGEPSTTFLRAAVDMLRAADWHIVNIDATVIAETPKIMKQSSAIRSTIGEACGLHPDRISVKATTNEGLGAIGRAEGVAAFATATLRRYL